MATRSLEMEVMPDHVHLLLDVNPQIGIAKIVGTHQRLHRHMRCGTEFPWLKKRLPSLWTRSKFVSSVDSVTLEVVQRYISPQKDV